MQASSVYVCIFCVFAVGVENPTKVYRTKNSAGVSRTWRGDGTSRLPAGRLELVTPFLVQVCHCTG